MDALAGRRSTAERLNQSLDVIRKVFPIPSALRKETGGFVDRGFVDRGSVSERNCFIIGAGSSSGSVEGRFSRPLATSD